MGVVTRPPCVQDQVQVQVLDFIAFAGPTDHSALAITKEGLLNSRHLYYFNVE